MKNSPKKPLHDNELTDEDLAKVTGGVKVETVGNPDTPPLRPQSPDVIFVYDPLDAPNNGR